VDDAGAVLHASERIEVLNARAHEHSLDFRRQFLGECVEVLVESDGTHGRCPHYFNIRLAVPLVERVRAGTLLLAKITDVTREETIGEVQE
jgi:tRNA A37 methylthiotransferase MiaB